MNDDPWRGPLVGLPDVIPLGVGERTTADDGEIVVFEPLRAFLERNLPPAESLVGVPRNGTNLLPRYGWVMPWGREGSGKTSVLVDLLFHAAAGLDWLGYPVGRPLRVVVIVNEGIPGGFQDKLRAKVETWPGDTDAVLDNLSVYASPWGEFTFRDRAMVAHARDYALDCGADYVALDPLHTLGTSGGGKPEETEAFKNVLRQFGVWDDLGVITAHHANKSGMVSGDWARHPDTVLHLEKDGKNPATKLTVEKARPADPAELGVPVLLEWVAETLGYRRVELEATQRTSDDELLAKVLAHLPRAPEHVTLTELQELVGGDSKRVAKLVKSELGKHENTVIRNVATHRRWYRLHRIDPIGETDSPNSTDYDPNEAQTRIDTGNLIGDNGSPISTGNGAPPSRDGLIGESVGGYVVPTTDESPNRTDGTDNGDAVDIF